ncbi:MAG: biopolymer transporter ExbD [Planctomycetota bacterium]|nr:biopolymer transporter ExbD [Planctomycetota bacterium]
MRIKRRSLLESTGMNMTPMIDVVFQLIVFLMLATDFTNTEIERVWLPKASEATADDKPDPKRLMVNVIHQMPSDANCPQLKYNRGILLEPCKIEEHWKIKIRGKELTISELEQALVVEGNLDRPKGPGTPSDRPVMIRADGSAPFKLITLILEAAGKALVWKIEIGAEKPPE